jgi:hypothetical protein
MFSNLEENINLTPDQQQQIIEKINQISQMRVNLYKTLSSLNQTYNNMLSNSNESINEQTIAIGIVEKELNESKKRLEAIEQEKNNQIRLIEINNYYSQQYSNHSKIFKIVLCILIPLILIVWLRNNAYLPEWLFTTLFLLVVVVGLWNLLPTVYYMWLRDNMNYQEYYWYFDMSSAPQPSTGTGSDTGTDSNSVDPWASPNSNSSSAMCQGQACCDNYSTYDPSLNVCVPNNNNTCSNSNTNVNTNANVLASNNSNSVYNTINNNITKGISNTSTGIITGVSNVSNNISSTLSGMTTNYTETFENLTSSSGSPNANNPIIDALTRPERENRYKKPDVTLGWSPQPTAGQSFTRFNGFN